jgi:hypothetical protein
MKRSFSALTGALSGPLLVFTLLSGASGTARAESWTINWTATMAGIPLGKMQSKLSLSGDTYSINGSIRTSGLAALIASFRGTVVVKGRRADDGTIIPTSYFADQVRKKISQKIMMAYKGGDIVGTTYVPDKVPNPAEVPITAADLRGARDPGSAFFLTLPKGETDVSKVCARTIRVFDGNEVYNIKMSFDKAEGRRPSGLTGPVVTCRARYQPIAGHNKGRKSVQRLAANDTMRVSFAQLDGTNAFVASEITLKAGIGRLVVSAN